MTLKLSTAVRNAMADAIDDTVNGGSGAALIRIYTGAQPANPAAAATGTLLATLVCSDPAFGSAAGGTITASSITADSSIDATGTAGWARIWSSNDGSTPLNAIVDLSVSVTGGTGDLQLDSVSLVSGGTVSISSLTITVPES